MANPISRAAAASAILLFAAVGAARAALVPVVTTTNVPVRVMAANLTDNSQSYEDFALRIFQGLKPDVVAIQEFNYLANSSNNFRAMMNSAFGTNFVWFRETNAAYSIPNGIISRWPIIASGSWDDLDLADRGFAWARLDLPGTNDLYVVSIHLKSGDSGAEATRRANQAAQLQSLVQSNFPPNALVVVAGDCNIQSSNETALATFKSFLVDAPIPTDAVSGGDPDTNTGRSERYDYVFPSPTLNAHRVGTVIGGTTYPNGLVFDSREFIPLASVAPVQTNDSGLAQHMAVLKDFRVSSRVTNYVDVPPPMLHFIGSNVLRWQGVSNVAYTVQSSPVLPPAWTTAGVVTSSTTNFLFTNVPPPGSRRFFRVTVP